MSRFWVSFVIGFGIVIGILLVKNCFRERSYRAESALRDTQAESALLDAKSTIIETSREAIQVAQQQVIRGWRELIQKYLDASEQKKFTDLFAQNPQDVDQLQVAVEASKAIREAIKKKQVGFGKDASDERVDLILLGDPKGRRQFQLLHHLSQVYRNLDRLEAAVSQEEVAAIEADVEKEKTELVPFLKGAPQ